MTPARSVTRTLASRASTAARREWRSRSVSQRRIGARARRRPFEPRRLHADALRRAGRRDRTNRPPSSRSTARSSSLRRGVDEDRGIRLVQTRRAASRRRSRDTARSRDRAQSTSTLPQPFETTPSRNPRAARSASRSDVVGRRRREPVATKPSTSRAAQIGVASAAPLRRRCVELPADVPVDHLLERRVRDDVVGRRRALRRRRTRRAAFRAAAHARRAAYSATKRSSQCRPSPSSVPPMSKRMARIISYRVSAYHSAHRETGDPRGAARATAPPARRSSARGRRRRTSRGDAVQTRTPIA